MTKQMIFTHGGGRFANQFLNQLNFRALELEYPKAIRITSLPFLRYDFFETAQEPKGVIKIIAALQKLIYSLSSSSRFQHYTNIGWCWILHAGATLLGGTRSLACRSMYELSMPAERTDETRLDVLVKAYPGEHLVLCGWPLRCWDLVQKHATALRADFTFKPFYTEPARRVVDHIRQQGFAKIIGLQIRQMDYRQFMDGRYSFAMQAYLDFANEAAQTLFPGHNVALLVTSDEKQDNLPQRPHIFKGPGKPLGSHHYMSDLIALSLCDLIIAPPSTFAATASFLGQTPYLPLTDKGQTPRREDVLDNGLYDAVRRPDLSGVIA